METAILMGLVGIGYLANNSNRDEAHPDIHPDINTPSHSTVYDQNNYSESKKTEETLAKDIIDKMQTNKNIVDNTQTYNNEHRRGNLNVGERDKYYDEPLKPIDINKTKEIQGKEYVYSQALDGYVSKNSFLTNDQGIASVPYFKGSAPPPINLKENYGLQAHQGGQHALNYGGKREQPQFFEPAPDNIYGNYFNGPNSDKNRYIPGTHRTNELPFEQEKIQPIDVKSELNREIDLAIAKTRSRYIKNINKSKKYI